MVAGANTALGLAEWAAEFLAGTPVVRCFPVLMHSQTCITDQITRRKRTMLGLVFFEGDKGFSGIDRFHGIVDVFHIVTLIRKKRTPLQRDRLVGCGKDANSNCGIHDVCWCGQLV